MCNCVALQTKILCAFLVWLLKLLCQAVITGLLASVICLRSKQLDCTHFLHGINTLVLALIAYNDIFHKNGCSLSIAGGNVLWKMVDLKCGPYDQRTLTELLYQFSDHHLKAQGTRWLMEEPVKRASSYMIRILHKSTNKYCWIIVSALAGNSQVGSSVQLHSSVL